MWTWWSVMITFSTPSAEYDSTRCRSEMRESADRIPWTWKSDETKPLVSRTRAICAFTTRVLPAVIVTGSGVRKAEYSVPRDT